MRLVISRMIKAATLIGTAAGQNLRAFAL